MLKGPLSLTIVVEAELVHRRVVDGPCMADVPLLKSLISNGPEAGHVRARRLELREWGDHVVIIKIVVKAEILLVIDAMVNACRKLIVTLRLHWRTHKLVTIISGSWDKLEQINRGGVLARKWNDVLLAGG